MDGQPISFAAAQADPWARAFTFYSLDGEAFILRVFRENLVPDSAAHDTAFPYLRYYPPRSTDEYNFYGGRVVVEELTEASFVAQLDLSGEPNNSHTLRGKVSVRARTPNCDVPDAELSAAPGVSVLIDGVERTFDDLSPSQVIPGGNLYQFRAKDAAGATFSFTTGSRPPAPWVSDDAAEPYVPAYYSGPLDPAFVDETGQRFEPLEEPYLEFVCADSRRLQGRFSGTFTNRRLGGLRRELVLTDGRISFLLDPETLQ